MAKLNLTSALNQAVRTESFEAEFRALSPLVLAFDMDKIVAAMAPDLVSGISANLLAGKQPDGLSMPRRADGQPRGVRTGLLARSIAARPSPTGLQIYASGVRGVDGAVMRVFYGKFAITPRQMSYITGKRKGQTVTRTAGSSIGMKSGTFWKQGFVQTAIKKAISVILGRMGAYRKAA